MRNVSILGMAHWVVLYGTGVFWTVGTTAKGQESALGDRFITKPRQLTFDGRRNGEAYFSPDGGKLIFSGEREPENPFFQIYVLDLASGDAWRVSPGSGKTTCAFFQPGTQRVLFASTHLDPDAKAKQEAEFEKRAARTESRYAGWDYDDYYDVFSCHRDGTDLRRLTDTPGYDAEAAYSHSGRMIVLSSMRNAFPIDRLKDEQRLKYERTPEIFLEIYLMNADGSDPRRLTDWPGYDGGPFFSPDDQRIIWRHFEESGMIADVYTMNLEGSDRKRLTDFGSMSWAPFYHPSNQYVIFASNKLGFENFELFLVDVEGNHEPVRVTFTEKFDGLAAFSLDGETLCWTSTRTADGQSQLFLAEWDHAAALKAVNESPMRTPKGTSL